MSTFKLSGKGGIKLACFDQFFASFRKTSGYELGNTSIDVMLCPRVRNCMCNVTLLKLG